MEIKKLSFEEKDIEIKETYVDKDGQIKERIKTVRIPTGKICSDDGEPGSSAQKQTSLHSSHQ